MGYNKETSLQDAQSVLQQVYEEDRKKVIDACKLAISNKKPEKLIFRRYRAFAPIFW